MLFRSSRLCCVALVLGLAAPVRAQGPLQFSMLPVVPRARLHAPALFDVSLHWQDKTLLTGRLGLEFRDGNALVCRYRSPELVLNTGTQRFRLLVPALHRDLSVGQLEATARFVSEAGTIELGRQLIYSAREGSRQMTLAVIRPRLVSVDYLPALVDACRFERWVSPEMARILVPSRTGAATMTAESGPASAYSWFAFDLVIVAGAALAQLGSSQLDALRAWLEAGGKLLLTPDWQRGPTPAAAEFMAWLLARDVDELVDADGAWVVPLPPGRLLTRHRSLGRVVIAGPETLRGTMNDLAWQEALVFLWSFRRAWVGELLRNGRLSADQLERLPEQAMFEYYGTPSRRNFQTIPRLEDALVTAMMPATVRVMPLWLIIVILAAFVIAIGPADYLILGYFRARRLTWIVFPAVSIFFTLATIVLARHFMGRQDQSTTLVVIDYGDSGQPVRSTQLEMIFRAGAAKLTLPFERGLFSAFDSSSSSLGAIPGMGEMVPPWHIGRYGGQYEVQQQVGQWRPQLNRLTVITPTAPTIAWPDGDSFRGAAATPMLNALAGQLPQGAVFALHGSKVDSRARTLPPLLQRLRPLLPGFCRLQSGLHRLVAQISPHAGASLDDLPWLDMTADNEWLFVVAVAEGDTVYVHRRLYREG